MNFTDEDVDIVQISSNWDDDETDIILKPKIIKPKIIKPNKILSPRTKYLEKCKIQKIIDESEKDLILELFNKQT